MQFETNSDYPDEGTKVKPLINFGNPQIDPCDKYTTNVLHNGQILIAQNVIVPRPRRLRPQEEGGRGGDQNAYDSDNSSDCSDSDADEPAPAPVPQQQPEHAFWPNRVIRGAIYGRVWYGVILRRCQNNVTTPDGDEVIWEVTDRRCAIKEYSQRSIRDNFGSAENPSNEISAMQHLSKIQRHHIREQLEAEGKTAWTEEDILQMSTDRMFESNIMLPIGVFIDNTSLYCVMPYVDGGELFDVLDSKKKFTEGEARYWMVQILNGVESLQQAGICHRDISLENLLTDREGRTLIIDMGMCFKIPYVDDANGGESVGDEIRDCRQRKRCLVQRDRACGKPYYMSPEIRANRQPFDAHAVDVWALGPILFLMVAGFPPWDIAHPGDERFYYISNGYFEQTVSEWNIGLSADLIDLLQRMFFLDPKSRLSLDQVRAHPWMQGERLPPPPPH